MAVAAKVAAIAANVEAELGAQVAKDYSVGLDALLSKESKSEPATDALERALRAAEAASDEKKASAAYAELLLAYGRALMVTLREQASEQAVLGPAVTKLDADKENDDPDSGGDDDDEGEEEQEAADNDDADESQDLFELTWEQLECARVIFEGLAPAADDRLAFALELLGDFGMENDDFAQAAADYEKAIVMHRKISGPNARDIGALRHSQYLALRRVEPLRAIDALNSAAELFKRRIEEHKLAGSEATVQEESEILDEMTQELKAFSTVIEQAQKKQEPQTQTGFPKRHDDPAVAQNVQTVQPRKRAKTNAGAAKVTFAEPQPTSASAPESSVAAGGEAAKPVNAASAPTTAIAADEALAASAAQTTQVESTTTTNHTSGADDSAE